MRSFIHEKYRSILPMLSASILEIKIDSLSFSSVEYGVTIEFGGSSSEISAEMFLKYQCLLYVI
jgi:hypothetical protein